MKNRAAGVNRKKWRDKRDTFRQRSDEVRGREASAIHEIVTRP